MPADPVTGFQFGVLFSNGSRLDRIFWVIQFQQNYIVARPLLEFMCIKDGFFQLDTPAAPIAARKICQNWLAGLGRGFQRGLE